MGETPELLKVPEVAARLRVDPQTVYRWASPDDDGTVVLKSVKIGGVLRFRSADVDELISRQAS